MRSSTNHYEPSGSQLSSSILTGTHAHRLRTVPFKFHTQNSVRLASSFPAMASHIQVLNDRYYLSLRVEMYKHEKTQRRLHLDSELDWQITSQQALAESEAKLDLQSMILHKLARAEKCRKASLDNEASDFWMNKESLMQELLATTFSHTL